MKISMYQASAPRFANTLKNLSAILDKAQAHVEARKLDPASLVAFRLYPDMFPFSRQIQIACDTAKAACTRLSGVENPAFPDGEQTLPELKARITRTIDFVNSLKPEQLDGTEDKDVTLKVGGKDVTFKGMQYLLGHGLPTFYFHVVTAYDILRHNGVEIGKKDYIGTP